MLETSQQSNKFQLYGHCFLGTSMRSCHQLYSE